MSGEIQNIFKMESRQDLSDAMTSLRAKIAPGTIVFLKGPMGAGKTEFVREFVGQTMGDSIPVQSPTFTIENIYTSESKTVFHFDLYRLKHWQEWLHLGLLERPDLDRSIVMIEWPDVFPARAWKDYLFGSSLSLFTITLDFENTSRNLACDVGINFP